ncbi:MAG: hypothetical protein A3K19_14475 [Lentisphaerae bacterium RIFOXYB12_FULL_65_16]|nr:MAG: hypothetical protein A3K18_18520 [Lentisphaerae bacterium RIFOXYA12_64_32]OGV87429.1 MAG: hypothetical protein A3K19_14475 [Lentisphaerae bacterium RIFOXYB12_FULL_65_16]
MTLKLYNLVLAAMFLAGVVVHPAWHKANTGAADRHELSVSESHPVEDENRGLPSGHDPDHCPVCQVAAVGCVPALPAVAPTPSRSEVSNFGSKSEFAPQPAFTLPYSCGPPA